MPARRGEHQNSRWLARAATRERPCAARSQPGQARAFAARQKLSQASTQRLHRDRAAAPRRRRHAARVRSASSAERQHQYTSADKAQPRVRARNWRGLPEHSQLVRHTAMERVTRTGAAARHDRALSRAADLRQVGDQQRSRRQRAAGAGGSSQKPHVGRNNRPLRRLLRGSLANTSHRSVRQKTFIRIGVPAADLPIAAP